MSKTPKADQLRLLREHQVAVGESRAKMKRAKATKHKTSKKGRTKR